MGDQSRPNVLVVDDDADALRLLERHLSRAGYTVFTATNGIEAMQTILAEGTPIVITDWRMPEMDGVSLCAAIRQHEAIPFAYIIMVTASETTEDQVVEALHAGADDYLCKPIKIRELLARMRAGERIVKLQLTLDSRNRDVHRYNAEIEISNTKLGAVNRELNRMATTDELTGLVNRREAMRRLSEAWTSSNRHGHPLSVISLDIDRFKSCNDVYGHAAGDAVLKETAAVLRRSARHEECVCRVGGEEFLVICPHATEEMAAVGAERMRRAVEANTVVVGDLTLRTTISLGVSQRREEMQSPDDLLRLGDEALYRAKDGGRNMVWLASRTPLAADSPEDSAESPPMTVTEVSRAYDTGTILVVDDDQSLRQLCRKVLERDGHHVLEACDGIEALEQMERHGCDVVLMDPVMPRLDGLACTRRLKANPATQSVPVILSSARADATDIVAGVACGADEYLPKPINPHELLLRVKTMVRFGRELAASNAIRGEQSRVLGLIVDLSRELASADSVDDVLERTLDAAAALSCCRIASVLLPDKERSYLRVARCLGLEPQWVADLRVAVGKGASGQVFQSQTPIVVQGREEAVTYAAGADAVLLSDVPFVSLPLCAPDGTLGVLNLAAKRNAPQFSTTELEYLDLIGNLAAEALHDRLSCRARDEARHSIVIALARLAEHRDNETSRHLERVSRFCIFLAEELRKDERFRGSITQTFLDDLERAVPLHDIGKVAVPDHILLKSGPRSEEELAVMRTHAEVGARTIRSAIESAPDAGFLTMAAEIAESHHEWHDGNGHPHGLEGQEIPLAARIVAVADVYDAITTPRPYQEAMSHERAVAAITGSAGRQFDPDVVDAFRKCESRFRRLAEEWADHTPTAPSPSADDPASIPAEPISAC